MAKKNVKKKAKPAGKKKNKVSYEYIHELIGISLAAFGVLLAISFYFPKSSGVFGTFIRHAFTGIMGITSYLIPLVVLTYSIFIIFKNHTGKFKRLFYLFILLVIISAMVQTGYYKRELYENLSVLNCLVRFFNDGKDLNGGGVLGGIISIPFLLLFQSLGTIIILATLAIINVMLLTEISLVGSISNFLVRVRDSLKDIGRKFDDGEETMPQEKSQSGKRGTDRKVIDFELEKKSRQEDEEEHENNFESEEEVEIERKEIDFNIYGLEEKNEIDKDITDNSNASAEHVVHEMYYRYPPIKILESVQEGNIDSGLFRKEAYENARKLEETLDSFGVSAKVINVSRGPTVTRYELQPSSGVKVSRIVNLADDISLNMASSGVRIEAPIPGKAAVGIEIPNREIETVYLKDVVSSREFKKHPSRLAFALGKNIAGESIVADISKMPHLLIAGATGAGKSVCINSLIISLLYKSSPDEVKMLMIDPKMVELGIYNGIPHMLIPVVTDPKKAAGAINWAVQEMVNRYKLFAEMGVRDIRGYNSMVANHDGDEIPLPQIVIIIDELSDLMMVAAKEVEDAICRLAQMARAAGMHLVIATQRPSVDVITGIIKANIPSRISFAVTSQVDSRTILDMSGAEKLLGRGDMLFYPVGKAKPVRLQGAFITENEVEQVVEFLKKHGNAQYDEDIIDELENSAAGSGKSASEADELLLRAIELVIDCGQASVSMLQRKFRVGYARAARIVDQMEERGIVGRFEGSKPRQVLVSKQQWLEMSANMEI